MAPSWPLVCVLLLALGLALGSPLEYVEVRTGIGHIRGFQDNVLGKDVNVFLGVPFGEPPLGSLRFQRPVPRRAWEGVWDATRRPATCFQVIDESFNKFKGVNEWNANTNMSEDCLYLNIWAPASSSPTPRAVMVWIYGGGFYGGSSTLDLYDGRTLAVTEDIIVVSMQYRVGTLGFLYLGTAAAPGNMGLVDQHLALQWVYNHIESFGGDHSRITLFGESAGAVSVSMHLVSPLSRKIFNNAIMQSGSALCRWAVEPKPAAKKRSMELARIFQCSSRTNPAPVNQVVACLRRQDPLELVTQMWTVQDEYNMITPILLTMDGYFLQEHPFTTVAEGRFKSTPVLLGGNKDEGSFFLVYGFRNLFYFRPNDSLPRADYNDAVRMISQSESPLIHEVVNFEYNVPQDLEDKELPRYVLDDMMGDADFLCPVIEFGRRYAEQDNKVYMYHFHHRTSANTWPEWMGIMHGYEIDAVFGLPLNETFSYSQEEKDLSRQIMHYWANFARTK